MPGRKNQVTEGKWETRLSRLESTVESLASDVGRIIGGLEGLSARFTTSQRTPWGVLAAWAAVVLAFCGMAASNIVGRVDMVSHAIESHEKISGHSDMSERVIRLEEHVSMTDATRFNKHQGDTVTRDIERMQKQIDKLKENHQ